jgi:hypothetical protein
MTASPDNPPAFGDPWEHARQQHTRLRVRMQEGTWEEDLRRRVASHVGATRSRQWRTVDLSSCPARVIWRELAVLYTRGAPTIRHDDETDADDDSVRDLVDAITESGLWSTMPRFQSAVIGCREYLLRVHADGEGRLRYRPISPDMVQGTSSADTPDLPDSIRELRWRTYVDPKTGSPKSLWVYDVLDVRDPAMPLYQVVEAETKGVQPRDLSHHFLEGAVEGADVPGLSGGLYPYMRSDGTPILPYVLYHAERNGDRLWDPFDGLEIVEGTLNIGVAWTMWHRVLTDSSWPQRWMANATVAGAGTTKDGDLEAVADPSVVLGLLRIDESQPVQVGQWKPGGDPLQLEEAITAYACRLATDAGISSSDLQKMTGDPRSGLAISLSEGGKRAAQRRFAPAFSDGDRRLIATSAAVRNGAIRTTAPEGGYAVVYQAIPMSPDELSAHREHVLELLDRGLIGPVQAYQEMSPGITEAQARQDLEDIADQRRDLLVRAAIDTDPAPVATELTEDPEPAQTKDPDGAAASTALVGAVALNGAQVTAAQGIVAAYAAGQLPFKTASAMLEQFFGLDSAAVKRLLDPVSNFTPRPPAT